MLATTKPVVAARATDPVIAAIADHICAYGKHSAALHDQEEAEESFGFESIEAGAATEAAEAQVEQELNFREGFLMTVPTTREGLFLYLEHLTSRMCFGQSLAPEHDEFVTICRTIEGALRLQILTSVPREGSR